MISCFLSNQYFSLIINNKVFAFYLYSLHLCHLFIFMCPALLTEPTFFSFYFFLSIILQICILQNMKGEEELQKLNNFFKNLYESLHSKVFSFHELSQTLNQLRFQREFDRECIKVKLQILQLVMAKKQQFQESELKLICSKLKIFGLSNAYLEEEGLINMYIDLLELNQVKNKENARMQEFTSSLIKYMEQLVKFFFLKNQLKHYRKCKNMLLIGIQEELQGQTEAMEQKIKQRVWTKTSSELFKQYLKNQQANDHKQLCRVCYKMINIPDLVEHVNNCGKRTYLKEQLTENFERRLTISSQLQHYLQTQKQPKDAKFYEFVEKVVQFYKCLIKDKMGCKKMMVRCQDKNISLFIQSQQTKVEKEPIVQLITELYGLENKAFCLSKKLQQVQSQLNITAEIKIQANMLKMSLDPSFKKYQSLTQKADSQPKEINKAPKKAKNEIENKILEVNSQEEEIYEMPIVKKRKPKKKMSVCDRYTMSQASDSNASEKNLREINVNNFQILKLLGKGAFGRVYLVRRKKTKDIYALKAIKIDKNWGEHQLQSIKNEYSIYKKIQGDHLVAATFSFNEKNVQFFVLEYMPGGDLSKILEENIYLQQKDATFYLAQILLAIQHLHKADIVHRDLKPQNVVLDAKGHLKLTDFGLSECRVRNKIQKVLGNKQIQEKERSLKTSSTKKSILKNKNGKKIIGTPDYIAPEIIEGKSLTNPTVDWWSFGVIAYELLIGCRPFSANSIEEILNNIQLGMIQWPQIGQEEQMISPVAVDLIKKLLKKNFQERLGFNGVEQIKKHEFFKDIDWANLKNSTPPQLSSASSIDNVQFLTDDTNLRKQLQILMESQLQNPLQQLRNYVRYDLLTAQTLQSMKEGAIKKQKRITKLKTIALNLKKEQQVSKVEYKPAFSSEQQNN